MAYGKRIKVYPLAQAGKPPPTRFTDAYDVMFDSTIKYDASFFRNLDRVVQNEPWLQRERAMIDQLRAQLFGAKWNLEKTTVRAPADGYVTNLALRKGARVTNLPLAPVMAFIDTADTIVGVEINQIDARYLAAGQPVEITFKWTPGAVQTGKVESILQAVATGQVQTSGLAVTPRTVAAAPFVVRVKLDDEAFARKLPAGSAGDAAIFTEHVKAAHVIRKVLLRQIAITNYVNPF